MLGGAQKNRIIRFACLITLFVYLLVDSRSIVFFAANITVIILLTAVLKKFNIQVLSGAAILVYSVIIDIICFYAFPLFTIGGSLSTYIFAGLLFNLRSALPAIGLGLVLNLFAVLKKTRKKQTLPLGARIQTFR